MIQYNKIVVPDIPLLYLIRNVSTKVVEKIKTHILCSVPFCLFKSCPSDMTPYRLVTIFLSCIEFRLLSCFLVTWSWEVRSQTRLHIAVCRYTRECLSEDGLKKQRDLELSSHLNKGWSKCWNRFAVLLGGGVMAHKTLVLCILFYVPERKAVPPLLLMMCLTSWCHEGFVLRRVRALYRKVDRSTLLLFKVTTYIAKLNIFL